MLEIEVDSVEDQLLNFCQKWLDNLVRGQFIGVDRPNDFGIFWDKQKIDEVVIDYLGEGVSPSISSKPLQECYPQFYKRDDGGFNLEFDLPLNGKLSDLTVQFEFNKKGNKFEVVLHDIHVF